MTRIRLFCAFLITLIWPKNCNAGFDKRILVDEETSVASLLQQMQVDIQNLKGKLTEKESQVSTLQNEIYTLQKQASSTGSTYVRWGRTDCSGDSVHVYNGFAAGKHYAQGGSGANILCLPNDPEWKNFADGTNSLTAEIYGVEMDVLYSNQDFGTSKLNKDIPCAVCKTSGRSAVVMIPGKISCQNGWNKEFSGYLVAQANEPGRSPTEYICADEDLHSVPGGDADDNEGVLYPVEVGSCNTMKCPPYVHGRELTCVVCSQ